MAGIVGRVLVSLVVCGLSACTTLSLTGHPDSDARLLERGAQSQFDASNAESQLRQQIPLIYFFAFQAGVLQLDPSTQKYPTFTDDLDKQQQALVAVTPNRWVEVAQAGEKSIDLTCGEYQSALYELDKNRRATLANLTAAQSATVGIMGLALAAQKAIGIVGIAFGLAASLFDTTLSSVLYQLPPASVVSVMNAQRDIFRAQETTNNTEWASIQNPIAVSNRLNEYIRYCTPVIIEANVGKLLGQTKADANGQLSAQTQPATGPTTPSLVRQSVYSEDLRGKVSALKPQQALIVERAMWAKLAERPADLQENLRAMIGPSGIVVGTDAQAFLRQWILIENATPTFEQEWNDAIGIALKQAPDAASTPIRTHVAMSPLAALEVHPAASAASQAVPTLEQQILDLQSQDALPIAQVMYPKLTDRSEALQKRMRALVGSEKELDEGNAKSFLIAWLMSDDPNPLFHAQWISAMGAESRLAGSSYGPSLRNKVLSLKAGAALTVAKAMYPHIAERPAPLRQTLLAGIPSIELLSEDNAKALLSKWIVLENATPAFEAQWTSALASSSE